MKTLLCGLLALACVPLAACDEAKTYDTACALADAAYGDWNTYATATNASAASRSKADAIYATAHSVCVARPTDTASALVTISNVGVQLAILIKTQKQKHPEVAVPVSLRRVVTLSEAR